MSRPRLHIRLPTNLYARLCEEADRPGASKSRIVEDALTSWFDPAAKAATEDRLLERLDAFDLRQSAIERDLAFTFEMLAHYVLYWLSQTEPVADGQRDASRALGKRRFDRFVRQVAAKVATAPARD
ncbi:MULTISPECIES: hypothetical protein [Hyphomonas]|uniref:Ribbon-helix-helix protein CopG domain-containing protein n=1 Tax=Hyphomonas adhaerens TaxID=81029 RepID=A0A3B9GYZ4_9PROT|nr:MULTISPECIES: hypothetical protein [Hyphomonas]MBB40907.1 hypothetical protein [Hyphomonas sp.]HAE27662.1 hypothetical protein [Hyphomonas adhaerens]|tara:strand:- start:58 stop:438 length:381 start_codon:yes stop_codon:yes gene_type:complete